MSNNHLQNVSCLRADPFNNATKFPLQCHQIEVSTNRQHGFNMFQSSVPPKITNVHFCNCQLSMNNACFMLLTKNLCFSALKKIHSPFPATEAVVLLPGRRFGLRLVTRLQRQPWRACAQTAGTRADDLRMLWRWWVGCRWMVSQHDFLFWSNTRVTRVGWKYHRVLRVKKTFHCITFLWFAKRILKKTKNAIVLHQQCNRILFFPGISKPNVGILQKLWYLALMSEDCHAQRHHRGQRFTTAFVAVVLCLAALRVVHGALPCLSPRKTWGTC